MIKQFGKLDYNPGILSDHNLIAEAFTFVNAAETSAVIYQES
jgi:hypothetical protein